MRRASEETHGAVRDEGRATLRFDIAKRLGSFELRCSATFGRGITAVFGPSGSGKTTLLNCVAGLARPDHGEIEVLGQAVYSSSKEVGIPPERRGVGYVFQDSALFPHLSVGDNIRYGHRLTREARRTVSMERVVGLLQLEELMGRDVSELSGGERQRVALARALAPSPRLLLLDEPISSLDLAFRGLILRYLKQVRDELGIPMVYVSHSISEVMAVADDVLVLSGGVQVTQGPPSTVLSDPQLGRLADYAALENLIDMDVVVRREDGLQVELGAEGLRLLAPEVEAPPGERVTISIRASDILVALDVPSRISAQNAVPGVVEEIHSHGPRVVVFVNAGVRMMAEITPDALGSLGLAEGDRVYLVIKSTSIVALEPGRRQARGAQGRPDRD